jgi:hypothetical protein
MMRLAQAARIFVAMLQEIFDESAYARFLQRSKMQPSTQAYAAFCHEHEAAKTRCPKCC